MVFLTKKKKKGSTVFLDVGLNLSSTYKAPWPCTAFVDAKGSVSVAFSAAESNLKCNEITHVQGTDSVLVYEL